MTNITTMNYLPVPKPESTEDKKQDHDQVPYEWLTCLGKGAFADVFLARRITDKKLFAMKVMKKAEGHEKRIYHAFRNELNALVHFKPISLTVSDPA